jgi:hypothetical protein
MSKSILLLLLLTLVSCKTSTSKSTTATSKYLFVSAGARTGLFGGIETADSICNSDANKPNSGTYKALIGVASVRYGSVGRQKDWVFAASTTYKRPNGTVIFTTNVNAVPPSSFSNAISTSSAYVWTGFDSTWGVSSNCTGWTSITTTGIIGESDRTDYTFAAYSNASCEDNLNFYCVEQ